MNRKELRERVETALQDPTNKHWSDVEINRYINDALVEFVKVVKQPQITGYATNPGGSTALGEIAKTGTLSVDGKTAKITFPAVHSYTEDDVLFVHEPEYFIVTVDAATNVVTMDGWHGFVVNDTVSFSSSDTLPAGISAGITYYVKTVPTTTTMTLSTSEGGSELDITNTGTGVHKVVISRTQEKEYLVSTNIKTPTTTTITYKVDFGSTVSSSPVSVIRVGPLFTKPSTIDEIVSVSIDGRELSIYTESELNQQAGSRQNRHFRLESSMGFHPNAFSVAVTSTDNTPRWRDQQGPVEAVVFNNRTSDTFRIYPLPKENRDLYVDKNATTKVFHKIHIRGVPKITAMATDSATPVIHPYYHEGLVYGALERAWLKEGQAQNLEKAQIYQSKFKDVKDDALQMEGLSGGSLNEGINSGSMRINRYL